MDKSENLFASHISKNTKTQDGKSVHGNTAKSEQVDEFFPRGFWPDTAPSAHSEGSEMNSLSAGFVDEIEVDRRVEYEIVMAESRAREYPRMTRVPGGTEKHFRVYCNFYVR